MKYCLCLFHLITTVPWHPKPWTKESQALFLSGEVSKVLDLAGHVSIIERSRTCSRHSLSLRDFSVPCQRGEDQSGKSSCARDRCLPLYEDEGLIQIRNIPRAFTAPRFLFQTQSSTIKCSYSCYSGLFNSRLKVVNTHTCAHRFLLCHEVA